MTTQIFKNGQRIWPGNIQKFKLPKKDEKMLVQEMQAW